MPPKTNYGYYMKKPEIRSKWENDKTINPITGKPLTSTTEGSVYYFLEKAYNEHKESTRSATSPKPTATSPKPTATSPRQTVTSHKTQSRKPGTLLSKAQEQTKQYLSDKLNSFTSESTYAELKQLVEDFIDLKEVIGLYLNREKYNPPYYGKNSIQLWIDKMREPEYQKRYIFYDVPNHRDYVIYNNYNFYFKAIMFAFVYGLLDSNDIPESLSKDSINGDIPSKFIELLKLLFQKYNFDDSNYRGMKNYLEEFKYLRYERSKPPITEKLIDIYKENKTTYRYHFKEPRKSIKELSTKQIKEIDLYLQKTLLKYNKKFQLSEDGVEFEAFLEKIKSLSPPTLIVPYSYF